MSNQVNKKVLRDIPAELLESVKADFELEGGEVEKKEQDNGLWTVIVTFPDE